MGEDLHSVGGDPIVDAEGVAHEEHHTDVWTNVEVEGAFVPGADAAEGRLEAAVQGWERGWEIAGCVGEDQVQVVEGLGSEGDLYAPR